MAVDGRAVAIQAQGNHREIAVARFAGHVALGAILDIPVKERARDFEVARVGIDDGEVRRGQEFSQDERRPGEESTAHNGGAADGGQLREQRPKGFSVTTQDEALQAGRPQHEVFESLQRRYVEPAQQRRPLADSYAGFDAAGQAGPVNGGIGVMLGVVAIVEA